MNILDSLLSAGQGAAVRQLGNQFGLAPEQTQSALASLLPALAAGLQQNATREGGLDSLMAALTGGSHQQYLDNPASLAAATTTADGNGILSHILGTKEVSRQVAQQAAARTGIDAGILKQMLPLVAAMVMGALSRQSQSAAPGQGAGLLSMLTPMLDQNRDGSVADDLLGMAGKLFGGRGGAL
jgi:hypothetical protein